MLSRDFRDWLRRLDLSPNRLREKPWFLPALLVLTGGCILIALVSAASAFSSGVRQPNVKLTAEQELSATITEELHAASEHFRMVEAYPNPENPTEMIFTGAVFDEEDLDALDEWIQSKQFSFPVKIEIEVLE